MGQWVSISGSNTKQETILHQSSKEKSQSSQRCQYPTTNRNSKFSPLNKILIYLQLTLPSILVASQVWAKYMYRKLASVQNIYANTADNVPWFVRGSVVQKEMNMPTKHERILRLSNSYHERFDDHPNELIRRTFSYLLDMNRKRKRTRGYLLSKQQ